MKCIDSISTNEIKMICRLEKFLIKSVRDNDIARAFEAADDLSVIATHSDNLRNRKRCLNAIKTLGRHTF